MTRMTRPDCAVMCNLINIHTYIHRYIHIFTYPHRMTNRMTGPDGAVMYNLINKYIHIRTYIHTVSPLNIVSWYVALWPSTHFKSVFSAPLNDPH